MNKDALQKEVKLLEEILGDKLTEEQIEHLKDNNEVKNNDKE